MSDDSKETTTDWLAGMKEKCTPAADAEGRTV
jgi:hypothetical protein